MTLLDKPEKINTTCSPFFSNPNLCVSLNRSSLLSCPPFPSFAHIMPILWTTRGRPEHFICYLWIIQETSTNPCLTGKQVTLVCFQEPEFQVTLSAPVSSFNFEDIEDIGLGQVWNSTVSPGIGHVLCLIVFLCFENIYAFCSVPQNVVHSPWCTSYLKCLYFRWPGTTQSKGIANLFLIQILLTHQVHNNIVMYSIKLPVRK